ncbi:MAG: Fic family protein [Proteobacteria bacterium]|nr:Fic family protein [Pseudomonadota bacterium]
MATPQEKLAVSLEALQTLQRQGIVAIRSRHLSRTHRERLIRSGYLVEIMKGWYIPSDPADKLGDSTPWYTSFWDFSAAYLTGRYGDDWCLSPKQSLSLHAGNRSVPSLLNLRAPKGDNKLTQLPHNTSLFAARYPMPDTEQIVKLSGLRIYSVPVALMTCTEAFFRQAPTDVRTAMATVKDASDLLTPLLAGGHSTLAGRIAGAFRNTGNDRIADEISKTMQAAGYTVRETDPFDDQPHTAIVIRDASPYVNRLRLMWEDMRDVVIDVFPPAPGRPKNQDAFMQAVNDAYVSDAYHSLSIEGYRVSTALIERVRHGDWKPDIDSDDREQRDALAARGYFDAFESVKNSLIKVLAGENAGSVADNDHTDWYRQLFGPSVTAGIISAMDLAGYRNGPVYIRRSMHTPPPREAVRDCMPALFDLLAEETEPSVRAVLGHFVFVYIHPYMDGNGRIGRFLMNVMLASGGYPWTVMPVDKKDEYMATLEEASVRNNIAAFAQLLSKLVQSRIDGTAPPGIPGS